MTPHVDPPPEFGVPLGVAPDGGLLRNPPFRPVLVTNGAPRTGKTRGVACPVVAAWPGPALVVSARADLLRLTLRTRAGRGSVAVWDPSGLLTGDEAALRRSFDLLSLCRTWAGAKHTASTLSRGASTHNIRDQDFWVGHGQSLLAVHLFAASTSGSAMRDVVRWAHTREEFEVRALLSGVADHDEAEEVFSAFTQLEERVASSIAATEQQLVAVFDNPSALASVDGGAQERLDFAELLANDATLYVIAPVARQQLYAPLITAVLSHVATTAIERHTTTDVAQRLLVLVDEAGTVGKLPDLPQLSSIAAGCGIQLVTIFHNPGQIIATYGAEASTVQANSETVLFLRGRDAMAAKLLDDLIGDDPGPDLPPGTGVTRLRRILPGHAILVRGFEDARLIRLLSPERDPDLRLELDL